tara:strand:- start:7455 stop:9812 length:2358 start_codon:yes stop_codon:yes gene_type:complete
MLKITGYSDKYSAHPGEEIKFYINAEHNDKYEAQIVRLIHGDTNPDGPGYKEEEIDANCNGTYQGKIQKIHGGSYIVVPQHENLNVDSFTLQAYIFPTTPDKGRQGIITKWNEKDKKGFGLFVDEDGCLSVEIGDGSQVTKISTDKKLLRKVWYLVAVTFDAKTKRITLYQEPRVTSTNGGLGMAILHPYDETTAIIETTSSIMPAQNDSPILIAASCKHNRSNRHLTQSGHYKEILEPIELPEQAVCYNGKIDRPRLSSSALSKAEIESLASSYDECNTYVRSKVIAAWDFHANITKNIASTKVVDTSPNNHHGFIVNMPNRGMTGHNWTADEMVYHHKPVEYGAIHFHDDDVDDSRWDVDFTFKVPENIKSGVYAARLRVDGREESEYEDFIPICIKPPKGKATAKILFLMPTNSYMAYSNDNLATNSVVAQLLGGKVPVMNPSDLYLNEHREYGLSTYSLHSDGHGVAICSRLRPILNMRPKYRHWLSPSLWQLNADLHLTDWLEEKGFEFDVLTDEDLEHEGVNLLNRYQVVLTGSHPEYSSEKYMDALESYQINGGRCFYLGSDGFYWISEYHPDNSNIIEVRKGEAGTRAWTSNPGEYNGAFDGKFGGMWRARGRVPSKVCGLTFTSYGFDVSSYYKREEDSFKPECSWMFNGIGADEVIGDFGLVGGGAAGLELDRYDLEMGTPHNAFYLARSQDHSNMMLQVNEEIHFSVRGYHGGGHENPMVRADMIYYKTPNDGAMFAPGSLAWCGSLSHNNYNNNVSLLMENVLNGFLKEGPLP